MKENNVGFTLIELLVVVLIIGILASIALPQYTKAVERARTAEVIQQFNTLAKAESIYYMTHGSFADAAHLDDMDITLGSIHTNHYQMKVNCASAQPQIAFVAERSSGAYKGGRLAIQVNPDGSILKACDKKDNSKKDEFCGFVSAAGYQKGTITVEGY